jgi:hypothetical protein
VSFTHLHSATKLSQVHPLGKRAQLLFTQARRRDSKKFGCSKQCSQASTSGCRALGGGSSAGQAPYLLDD